VKEQRSHKAMYHIWVRNMSWA